MSMSTRLDNFQKLHNLFFCKICVENKQQRNKFPKLGSIKRIELLGIVHSNICGHIQTPIHYSCSDFIRFINDLCILANTN
jgi:hypothetical protein